VKKSKNYFEFFGFDVIVDSNLRPWLLEINSPPQLHVDGCVDKMVKPFVARDMFMKVFHQREEEALLDIDSDLDDDLPVTLNP